MSKKPDYLVQVMEKIGAPLAMSVSDVAARLEYAAGQNASAAQPPEKRLQDEAEKMASLLNKSVELAIALSQLIDMPETPQEADSVRLALTALAGPILANQYRMTTRLPLEGDVGRAKTALETIMSFVDNYDVAGDANVRLANIDKDFYPADKTQIQIVYVQALVPVISAIGTFPFGVQENTLVREVCERLIQKAKTIREAAYPNLSGGDIPKCELGILRALANIYSQCHFGEMARIMSLPPEQQQSSIDPVWTMFEARCALVEFMAKDILPDQAGTSASESVNMAPPPGTAGIPPLPGMPPIPPQGTPQNAPPPAQDAPPPPPVSPQQPAPTAQPAVDNSTKDEKPPSENAGPMSFFKKPVESEDQSGA